ncbi:MAG: two-component system response regulator [Thalassolituus sp.]|nr:response regulator [Pseudomonadota bacterium]TNC87166.1 MAG: two-component system response regulator [Thalassolituus sp.]
MKLRVLVVDDAAFVRDLVKKAVRDTYPGCEINEATDGRKAVTMLNQREINLVLCDWEMPEMSGIEVLEWMRSDERYKKTPFMMITSRGDRDHVVKAVQAGVSDYIGKPFTRENFVEKVSKVVAKHLGVKPGDGPALKGMPGQQSADVLMGKPASASPSGGATKSVSNDMGGASVLMGGGAKQAAPDKAAAPSGSAPKTQAQGAKSKNKARGVASVRFGSGGSAKLVLKDINLQEMIGVFRREGALPALLEPAVADIVDQDSGDVARINGYVRMMQAQEPHPDAETIQMLIRFVDDDEDKLSVLSRFIAKVR